MQRNNKINCLNCPVKCKDRSLFPFVLIFVQGTSCAKYFVLIIMTLIKCPYLIFYFNNVHQQLRREGARLFMLWFQALQGNSDELCQVIYASLIPGFPNPIESVEWTGSSKLSKEGAEEIFQSICETGCYERQSSTSSVHLPSAEKESEGHYLSRNDFNFLVSFYQGCFSQSKWVGL